MRAIHKTVTTGSEEREAKFANDAGVEDELTTLDQGGSDFEQIYARWFDDVSRWVRALGAQDGDREDLVQDVFVVVHRRLHDFDGGNLPGWLYQIARRRVRDYRRLKWFKNLVSGRAPLPENLTSLQPGPLGELETREKRLLLEQWLEKLNDSERAALLLFEIDGMSGADIAQLQDVPLNTVWARIHNARRKLEKQLGRHRRSGQKGGSTWND